MPDKNDTFDLDLSDKNIMECKKPEEKCVLNLDLTQDVMTTCKSKIQATRVKYHNKIYKFSSSPK
uniref:Uncharacterized protein n=1 Tax=Rhizophora mucronata TaxID=61149 RepID=A0A2P2N129_RHIMU